MRRVEEVRSVSVGGTGLWVYGVVALSSDGQVRQVRGRSCAVEAVGLRVRLLLEGRGLWMDG